MKRYFIVPEGKLPHRLEQILAFGEYHYIDLDSHEGSAGTAHRVLVQMDGNKTAHPDWEELPHLLDGDKTLGHEDHAEHLKLLKHLPTHELDRDGRPVLDAKGDKKIVRPSAEHGGYKLARLLQSLHPLFKP